MKQTTKRTLIACRCRFRRACRRSSTPCHQPCAESCRPPTPATRWARAVFARWPTSDKIDSSARSETSRCGAAAATLRSSASQTPWVDWSRYWGAADASSQSNVGLLPDHLSRNKRGVDGALLDLEYQRLDLLRFNLFDNTRSKST